MKDLNQILSHACEFIQRCPHLLYEIIKEKEKAYEDEEEDYNVDDMIHYFEEKCLDLSSCIKEHVDLYESYHRTLLLINQMIESGVSCDAFETMRKQKSDSIYEYEQQFSLDQEESSFQTAFKMQKIDQEEKNHSLAKLVLKKFLLDQYEHAKGSMYAYNAFPDFYVNQLSLDLVRCLYQPETLADMISHLMPLVTHVLVLVPNIVEPESNANQIYPLSERVSLGFHKVLLTDLNGIYSEFVPDFLLCPDPDIKELNHFVFGDDCALSLKSLGQLNQKQLFLAFQSLNDWPQMKKLVVDSNLYFKYFDRCFSHYQPVNMMKFMIQRWIKELERVSVKGYGTETFADESAYQVLIELSSFKDKFTQFLAYPKDGVETSAIDKLNEILAEASDPDPTALRCMEMLKDNLKEWSGAIENPKYLSDVNFSLGQYKKHLQSKESIVVVQSYCLPSRLIKKGLKLTDLSEEDFVKYFVKLDATCLVYLISAKINDFFSDGSIEELLEHQEKVVVFLKEAVTIQQEKHGADSQEIILDLIFRLFREVDKQPRFEIINRCREVMSREDHHTIYQLLIYWVEKALQERLWKRSDITDFDLRVLKVTDTLTPSQMYNLLGLLSESNQIDLLMLWAEKVQNCHGILKQVVLNNYAIGSQLYSKILSSDKTKQECFFSYTFFELFASNNKPLIAEVYKDKPIIVPRFDFENSSDSLEDLYKPVISGCYHDCEYGEILYNALMEQATIDFVMSENLLFLMTSEAPEEFVKKFSESLQKKTATFELKRDRLIRLYKYEYEKVFELALRCLVSRDKDGKRLIYFLLHYNMTSSLSFFPLGHFEALISFSKNIEEENPSFFHDPKELYMDEYDRNFLHYLPEAFSLSQSFLNNCLDLFESALMNCHYFSPLHKLTSSESFLSVDQKQSLQKERADKYQTWLKSIEAMEHPTQDVKTIVKPLSSEISAEVVDRLDAWLPGPRLIKLLHTNHSQSTLLQIMASSSLRAMFDWLQKRLVDSNLPVHEQDSFQWVTQVSEHPEGNRQMPLVIAIAHGYDDHVLGLMRLLPNDAQRLNALKTEGVDKKTALDALMINFDGLVFHALISAFTTDDGLMSFYTYLWSHHPKLFESYVTRSVTLTKLMLIHCVPSKRFYWFQQLMQPLHSQQETHSPWWLHSQAVFTGVLEFASMWLIHPEGEQRSPLPALLLDLGFDDGLLNRLVFSRFSWIPVLLTVIKKDCERRQDMDFQQYVQTLITQTDTEDNSCLDRCVSNNLLIMMFKILSWVDADVAKQILLDPNDSGDNLCRRAYQKNSEKFAQLLHNSSQLKHWAKDLLLTCLHTRTQVNFDRELDSNQCYSNNVSDGDEEYAEAEKFSSRIAFGFFSKQSSSTERMPGY